MPAPGPKPTPTALRILQGGASPKNDREPMPVLPSEVPDPPAWLTGYAVDEWRRIAEDLFATGVYANIDETALAAYCVAYQRWRHAEEDVRKMAEGDPLTHAALVKTTNGNAIHNPLVGVASAAMRDMLRLSVEFGLTPSSRTQIESIKREGDGDGVARKYGL
jgi:P27 family predicted phage terminase small subunit